MMRSVSDDILIDTGAYSPVYEAVYPMLDEFNLSEPSSWTKGQPYEFFKKMREQAPIMWTKMDRGMSGFWSVTRYDDIKEVELKPEIFSSQRGSINMAVGPRDLWRPKRLTMAAYNSLINMDAPKHMEMRLQQKDFFTPNFAEGLRDKVGRKIDSLLDDMEEKGPVVDFAKLFSEQVPLYTLCEMLGVDEDDRPDIVRWMHYLELAAQFIVNRWYFLLREPRFIFKFEPQVREMFAYGEKVLADRRVNPRKDLLTAIARSKQGEELLSQDFLDGSWLLIIFAGNDTSRNSLSGTIRLMTEFPDQRYMVLDDPSLIPRMSREALRMVSPVIHMRRTATDDAEINGQRIAKHEKLVLWYGAANRDPDIFPDPDRFDMTRDNVDKHIAFGHGVHKCLGSRIAEMQLTLAYERIFDRFPNITWTGRQKISPNVLVHAISSLQVNLYGEDGKRPTQVQVGATKH